MGEEEEEGGHVVAVASVVPRRVPAVNGRRSHSETPFFLLSHGPPSPWLDTRSVNVQPVWPLYGTGGRGGNLPHYALTHAHYSSPSSHPRPSPSRPPNLRTRPPNPPSLQRGLMTPLPLATATDTRAPSFY